MGGGYVSRVGGQPYQSRATPHRFKPGCQSAGIGSFAEERDRMEKQC